MPTSSIQHNIVIKDKRQCRKMVRALERAENATPRTILYSNPVYDMTPEQIKKVFAGSSSPK